MPVGFIGLGVMGEPMCLNLIERLDDTVVAFDLRPEPVTRVAAAGAAAADSVAEVAGRCEVILLSLPGGPELEAVVAGPRGVLESLADGRTGRDLQGGSSADGGTLVVDHSTAPVALTRDLADRVRRVGGDYLDAPVARTRQAARDGTLSIMVGGTPAAFDRVRPILSLMGSEVTRCGGAGSGQVAKLMNNMVLFQNVRAVAEAHAIVDRLAAEPGAEIDLKAVFDVIGGASGGSFALANHGRKSILADDYPADAFSTRYALKDLGYALALARELGVETTGATSVGELMEATLQAGFADEYFPVLRRML